LLEHWRDNPPIVDYLAIFDRAFIKRRRTGTGEGPPAAPWLRPGLDNAERERLAREAIRGIKSTVGDTGLMRG
jgi:hypothetical protein